MNVNREYIFYFFVIFCFLTQSFCFVEANDDMDAFARNSANRRVELLCYAATYHGEMPGYFEQHISHRRLIVPSMRDSELEEGLEEWRSIKRNSIGSAFLDFYINGQPDIDIGAGRDLRRADPFGNTNDVLLLIKGNGFEEAIKECAERKGLVFEDLRENMKNTLLRMDRLGTYFGRGIQFLVTEPVWGRALRGAIWGLGLTGRGINRWIFTPVRSWVSTTALQRVTSSIGVLGATAMTRDSDIVLANIEENVPIEITEEDAERLEGYSMKTLELIDMLNTGGAYRTIIEMFRDHELDIDHLDNQTTLQRDLAILIDTYFVDYDYVNRQLEALKVLKGEHHQDTVDLNLIRELFDWRKRQLENQTDDLSDRAVAFELLSLVEDNSSFLCLFSEYNNLPDDNRSDVLCKIHLFYTIRNYHGLSPRATLELERLEAILENL